MLPQPHIYCLRLRNALAAAAAVTAVAAGAGSLAGLAGCEVEEDQQALSFRDALPSEDLLLFDVPDDEAPEVVAGGLAVQPAALVGEASSLHRTALNARRAVNNGLMKLLQPIWQAAHSREPTMIDGGRAAWIVPPEVGGLDRHVLIVDRFDDGHFEYSAWSRRVANVQGSWRFRVYGSVTPGPRGQRGRGVVWANLDTDNDPRSTGKVAALWSELDGVREVIVNFYDASADRDDSPPRTHGALYRRRPNGAGLIVADLGVFDVDDEASRDALERVKLISRWNGFRHGRTDISATGGDVEADGLRVLVRSECWDAAGRNIVWEAFTSVSPAGERVLRQDGEARACAFPNLQVAVAPDPGTAPAVPGRPFEAEP